jgi:dinuclear metal center YbgI/SA1388 family protein
VTVQDVLGWLDAFAPFATQETFDNAGLVLGDPRAEVTRVYFTLDATADAVHDASEWNAQLIVSHHPLLFGGAKAIRTDTAEGDVITRVLGERMNLIAAHTNLDRAAGGTGDALAAALGLTGVRAPETDTYLRHGRLNKPLTAKAFLTHVNASLSAQARLYGDETAHINHVAVGAGAYGEGWQAAAALGAQAYVVGEIKHHELLAAHASGLTVVDAGHYPTEQPGVEALYRRFLSDAQAGRWPVTARLNNIPPYPCAM